MIAFGVPNDVNLDEIKSEDGCIWIRKLYNKNPDDDTSPILLAFEASDHPPETIKLNHFLQIRLRVYKKRSMQCQHCWMFGHVTKNCRSEVVCGHCSKKGHSPSQCNDTDSRPKRINCGRDHRAGDQNCRQYIVNQDIIDLAEQEDLPFRVAQAKWNQM